MEKDGINPYNRAMSAENTAPTILLADDNGPTRDLIASILTPAGYQVVQAEDGEAALYVAQAGRVDCAIIDQYMTPVGGFEFARLLEKEQKTFPMILITAHETSDLLVEARDNGFTQILKKPIQPERLLKMVQHVLRK